MADKSYHELIDEEWKIVEKTELPQIDALRAFNGILWILKSGATWRFLPEKYGKQCLQEVSTLDRSRCF